MSLGSNKIRNVKALDELGAKGIYMVACLCVSDVTDLLLEASVIIRLTSCTI